MSYFLYDLNTKFNFDKLIIGKQIKINDELSKYYIYYLDDKPKSLLVKVPPTRIIYNYKNNKYEQIKLPLYPLWEKNIIFINFIKELEKKIKSYLSLNKEFSKSIDKKDNINTLKFYIQKTNTFHNYEINSEIECIINISYIWEKETTYGISIYNYQTKYIPRIDELNIDFFDEEIKENKIIEYKKPINIEPVRLLENRLSKPQNLVFGISPLLLTEAMSRLNKVK